MRRNSRVNGNGQSSIHFRPPIPIKFACIRSLCKCKGLFSPVETNCMSHSSNSLECEVSTTGNDADTSNTTMNDLYEAIVDLAETKYQKLLRFAFVVVRDIHVSEDCVQDAFTLALEKCHQFRGGSNLYTWFTAILLNQCRGHLRSKWRQVLSITQSPLSKEAEADFSERIVMKSDLTECLLQLPTKYRIPVYLYYYEDLDIQSISEIIHLQPATCRVTLLRGRKKLRGLFERMTENE